MTAQVVNDTVEGFGLESKTTAAPPGSSANATLSPNDLKSFALPLVICFPM